MAKRAAPDEKPFRPLLDAGLISAALSHGDSEVNDQTQVAPQVTSAKILEMPRAEAQRRSEPVADVGRARRADAPSIPSDAERSSTTALVEKFDHEKRILFTRPESQAIDRLVLALATRFNSQVKVSHVIRSLVALLLNAEAEVDRRAGESGPLVRPANGDAQGLQRFEREIARVIGAALRDAGPLR